MRGDDVLLLRRCNTGYQDGKLSVPAGHVEPGEPVTRAALRELREEVGLELSPDSLRVAGVMHRREEEARVDFFLVHHLQAGAPGPRNCEPAKCSELVWATAASLPADTIAYVRAGIENWRNGVWFQEFGW